MRAYERRAFSVYVGRVRRTGCVVHYPSIVFVTDRSSAGKNATAWRRPATVDVVRKSAGNTYDKHSSLDYHVSAGRTVPYNKRTNGGDTNMSSCPGCLPPSVRRCRLSRATVQLSNTRTTISAMDPSPFRSPLGLRRIWSRRPDPIFRTVPWSGGSGRRLILAGYLSCPTGNGLSK